MFPNSSFAKRPRVAHMFKHGGDWRLAVGDSRLVAVGGGWWLAVGRRWRLAVGGWWRLVVGGWWSLGAVLKGGPE